ncbi:MAG TPA: hypothetical protein VIN06_20105 [Devosia sp.]
MTTDGQPSDPKPNLTLRRIELSAAPIARLINTISLVSGLIAVIIIVSVVGIALLGEPIPAELSNWGGIILGFYFGQFVNLLKDYMGIVRVTETSPDKET